MIGVLAQQVRPLYPDAVETDSATALLRVSSSSLHYLISFIHLKRLLVRIGSQSRYVQTQSAVSRLVYLGQFCTN